MAVFQYKNKKFFHQLTLIEVLVSVDAWWQDSGWVPCTHVTMSMLRLHGGEGGVFVGPKQGLTIQTSVGIVTSLTQNHGRLLFIAFEYVFVGTEGGQEWSLTQFYSVNFSQSRIGVESAVFLNAQSRLASVVLGGVL